MSISSRNSDPQGVMTPSSNASVLDDGEIQELIAPSHQPESTAPTPNPNTTILTRLQTNLSNCLNQAGTLATTGIAHMLLMSTGPTLVLWAVLLSFSNYKDKKDHIITAAKCPTTHAQFAHHLKWLDQCINATFPAQIMSQAHNEHPRTISYFSGILLGLAASAAFMVYKSLVHASNVIVPATTVTVAGDTTTTNTTTRRMRKNTMMKDLDKKALAAAMVLVRITHLVLLLCLWFDLEIWSVRAAKVSQQNFTKFTWSLDQFSFGKGNGTVPKTSF